MTWVVYLITYASLATFAAAVASRIYRLVNMPIHLRWELYPVAHEKEGLEHGGSYMEQTDYWTKPRQTSVVNMLSRMLPEMIFIKALWEHNRALWYRSFPFHFGLYMLIGTIALLVLGVFSEMVGLPVAAGSASVIGGLIYYLTIFTGAMGMILALIGTIGLLHRRLTDEDLEGFTTSSHIFNLAFFLVALSVAFLAFLFVDHSFAMARGYIRSLITFSMPPLGSWLVTLEVVLASVLIAYIPLTHMSHFFTKWFMYHEVLWDDVPNLQGSKMEAKLMEYLKYPVSWSAPHIAGDGKKTWVDVATEEIPK